MDTETFTEGSKYLHFEYLSDDLVHFELSEVGSAPTGGIYTSPMIAKTDYAGTTASNCNLDIIVDTGDLSFQVKDKTRSNLLLTNIDFVVVGASNNISNVIANSATSSFRITNNAVADFLNIKKVMVPQLCKRS